MVLKNYPKCLQQMEKLLFKKIYSILVRTESVLAFEPRPTHRPCSPPTQISVMEILLWKYAAKQVGLHLHLDLSLGLWFPPGRDNLKDWQTPCLRKGAVLQSDQTVKQFVLRGIVENGK